jgi:hypothetical protein
MTATIAIPTPARVRFPRVWTGGRRCVSRAPGDARDFFDLCQISLPGRCQAPKNIAQSLPVAASFRCLRHAVKDEREANEWRAMRSARILRINAMATG